MQHVIATIRDSFDLTPLEGRPTNLSKHRRLLARRMPGRRSSSAPPVLEALSSKIPAATVPKAAADDYFRRFQFRGNERGRNSPEPIARRSVPQPTAARLPTGLAQERKSNQNGGRSPARPRPVHRSRSLSPPRSRAAGGRPPIASPAAAVSSSFLSTSLLSPSAKPAAKSPAPAARKNSSRPLPEAVRQVASVRQLEMLRERLAVQQRDRTTRRRSFLAQYEETQTQRRRSASSAASEAAHSLDSLNPPPLAAAPGSQPQQTAPLTQQRLLAQQRRAGRMADDPTSSADGFLGRRPSQASEAATTTAPSSSTARPPLRLRDDWQPPQIDPVELEKARRVPLPPVTAAQQTAVRDWLLSLGLSVMDGEGGYYRAEDLRLEGSANLAGPHSAATALAVDPLPLRQDRLRNGETLCVLFCLLEPAAAQHSQLFSLIRRSPRTIAAALENLEKVLWLLRLRRCPPLPAHLLVQADEIVRCNVPLIWGLLWELMQTYAGPSAASASSLDGLPAPPFASAQSFGNLATLPVNRPFYRPQQPQKKQSSVAASSVTATSAASSSARRELGYSPVQRRSLDLSLVDWLDACGLLRQVLGPNTPRPPTVLALEPYLKDGSLLCQLLETALGLPLEGPHYRHPHTFSQCLANLAKAVRQLRACKAMPPRFLYAGVEDDIARGHWDAILGLLEDVHLLADTVADFRVFPHRRPVLLQEETPAAVQVPAIPPAVPLERIERPYLGPASLRRSTRPEPSLANPNANANPSQPPSSLSHSGGGLRLDRFYPSDPDAPPPPRPSLDPPLPTTFRPALDLRQSLQSADGQAEENEPENENDVSFLFSPQPAAHFQENFLRRPPAP